MESKYSPQTLCIIGLGLIGGSIACAARKNLSCQIIAIDEDQSSLASAKQLGIIDDFHSPRCTVPHHADCVIIATPVGAVQSIFTYIKPNWNPNTLYTDVGSTKSSVLAAATQVFSEVPTNFIGGHPIAGSEQSGVMAARDDLFLHKQVLLTPLATTDPKFIQRLRSFWQQLGSKVDVIPAAKHDSILAACSHLPHLLAFVLTDLLGQSTERQLMFKYAGAGFHDFTRIAASDPTMWRDICLANKQELLAALRQLQGNLAQMEQMLAQGESELIAQTFSRSQLIRQRLSTQTTKPN